MLGFLEPKVDLVVPGYKFCFPRYVEDNIGDPLATTSAIIPISSYDINLDVSLNLFSKNDTAP